MLYILLGEDDFSLQSYLEKIKRDMGDPALLYANTTALDGQPLTPDQLRLTVETAPFLGGSRLVIVSGLLERFEPKSKPLRNRKAPTPPTSRSGHAPFLDAMSRVPPSTTLVLIDAGASKNNPLLKELSGRAEVRTFPRLSGDSLRQWVRSRMAGEGGTISPEAVELLARLIGGNLRATASEISKLVMFASGRRIEEADVKQLVGYAQESSVFAMVDAVLGPNGAQAERHLYSLLQSGASSAYILTMLARQSRMIVRAKELKKQGLPDIEIQSRLGLAEFARRKTMEQASRYSWEQLKHIYRKLLETDLAIKTGKYGDELALNIMIAELAQPPVDRGVNVGYKRARQVQ